MSKSKQPQPAAKENGLPLELLRLKKAALVLCILNHELRLHMLQSLHRRGPSTVTELYRTLDLEQAMASTHLALLRRARLVMADRQGRCIYYSVNYRRVAEVQALTRQLTGSQKP